jgi:hypothetical protein
VCVCLPLSRAPSVSLSLSLSLSLSHTHAHTHTYTHTHKETHTYTHTHTPTHTHTHTRPHTQIDTPRGYRLSQTALELSADCAAAFAELVTPSHQFWYNGLLHTAPAAWVIKAGTKRTATCVSSASSVNVVVVDVVVSIHLHVLRKHTRRALSCLVGLPASR